MFSIVEYIDDKLSSESANDDKPSTDGANDNKPSTDGADNNKPSTNVLMMIDKQSTNGANDKNHLQIVLISAFSGELSISPVLVKLCPLTHL